MADNQNLEAKVKVANEAFSLRIGKIIRSVGYDCANTPKTCNGAEGGVKRPIDYAEDNLNGVALFKTQSIRHSRGEMPENSFYLIGTILPEVSSTSEKDIYLNEKNKSWKMRVYGRGNMRKIESLAKNLSKEFRKNIVISLESESSPDYDPETGRCKSL